jgi:hypothetical protein
MKSKDNRELFVRNFANCRFAICAFIALLLPCVFCVFQDDSFSAARSCVGGFSCVSVAMFLAIGILAIGLAAAFACELSHNQASANNIVRAMPAVNISGPEYYLLQRRLNCHSNIGSTPVWGSGQTSYASIEELRVYSREAKHQLKIATVAREVARAD